jgi:hypothetical protein
MRAFTNTQVTKPQLVASLEGHAAADRIVKGAYWEDNQGCAVGCSIHDFRPGSEDVHGLYPELFGIPESLARLEDRIFEELPVDKARQWPLRFARAVQSGSDLSRVTPGFLYRVLARRRDAVKVLPDITEELRTQVVSAIEGVLAVVEKWRDTGILDASAARSAESAAESAAAWSAASAAWSAASAAESAAAWSAESAARSAESAARSAASAAWSAESAARSAASAAWSAEYEWMADQLIAEIESAPVEEIAA